MPLTFDPEIATALAPMAESGFATPAVGDIAGRRTMREPIIGAASTAQPIPADVTTSEHYATADDGARIQLRWYVKDNATPRPASSGPTTTALPRGPHCSPTPEGLTSPPPRRRPAWRTRPACRRPTSRSARSRSS